MTSTSRRPLLVLTGATGYVGGAILRRIRDTRRDVSVRALVRQSGAIADASVEQVVGSLPAVPEGFIPREPHVLVHFGVKQLDPDGTGFERTNVEGTRALFEQCNEFTLGAIYSSSLSVLGQGAQSSVTEDAEPAPATELARSRARAEEIVLSAMDARGLAGYCLRPRFVVGGDDRFVGPGMRSLASRNLRIGSGRQVYSVIHCDDYAELVLRLASAIARGDADGCGPVHVGYKAPISHDALVDALAGSNSEAVRWRLPVPRWLPRLIRAVPVDFAKSLATKLELVGFDHFASTALLESLVGSDLIDRNPVTAIAAAQM